MQTLIFRKFSHFSARADQLITPLTNRSLFITCCHARKFHCSKNVRLKNSSLRKGQTFTEIRPDGLTGWKQHIRWNGTDTSLTSVSAVTGPNSSILPDGYIPEPPLPPVPAESGSQLIEQLTALGEPTLQSLGLSSWYPNGLVQTALEAIHVNLNVPWWTSIVIGTVCLRFLIFPLVIIAQRNAAAMHNHMPVMQHLQDKFTKAKQAGNPMEAARAGAAVVDYMKEHKVNPLKNMMMPFVQLPIFISVFVGVRQMANLPVQSMTTGGIAWFTDLTIPDPYYALPVLTMATFFATVELGVDGVRASSMTKTMRMVMRVMPLAILPFTINFPTGMLCYWLTSNLFSLIQVLFLRIEGVRRFFKIPPMVLHDPTILPKKKPFFKEMKETWKNSKTIVDVQERQRQEAIRFKESGIGSIQKTYAYDPTKNKAKDTAVSMKSK